MDDFISGVDNVSDREVLDFQSNKHGSFMSDFLIDSNCCILNGRNHIGNNFTFVGPQGCSVVDYCLVPYEYLGLFENSNMILVADLMTNIGINDIVGRASAKPDHSILSWDFHLDTYKPMETAAKCGTRSFTVFDRSHVPTNFLENKYNELNSIIQRLEADICTQESVNNIYDDFAKLVSDEMKNSLPYREIKITDGVKNKKRRTKKPWWTSELTSLWNDLCVAEKRMLRSNGQQRKISRNIFNEKRKLFDRTVQREKGKYWFERQSELETLTEDDSREFWKKIGRTGVGEERKKIIPMEIYNDEGEIIRDKNEVMKKWKNDFQTLLNPIESEGSEILDSTDLDEDNDYYLNSLISSQEVVNAMKAMKRNKAFGADGLPAEVLKGACLTELLVAMFNKCFSTGITPEAWKYGIIQPIPKSSTSNIRDPLGYRGITLTSVVYKMYCYILNKRLTVWDDRNGVISDTQNGFHKGRSTLDHISTLTSIIETRKLKGKSTFAAFIDFKKAYDSINRNLLFTKLNDIGIGGNMFKALLSVYKDVKCCVRLNGIETEWFPVDCGLKQGCSLSPILFNFFINDLVTRISAMEIGIDIDGENVAILLYADDAVLVCESEKELQVLLQTLHTWCTDNKLAVNHDKSKVVHFRPQSVQQTQHAFMLGEKPIGIETQYTYLGLLLTEHMDYNSMAKQVAKSANRALGLVISKYKAFGGLPYNSYTKLYDSIVYSTISYGAAIWGYRRFSCISAVQNRAARFFMGVGRYTPNTAVMGDMGWTNTESRQWEYVINQWFRLRSMDANRLNFKVFKWSCLQGNNSCKNWCMRVKQQFRKCDIENSFWDADIRHINKRSIRQTVKDKVFNEYKEKWEQDLARNNGLRGVGGNKLRTYRLFKQDYKVEPYISCIRPKLQRSAFAKFRCGVAPLRIETGRYERLDVDDRICPLCNLGVETEEHVLLTCTLYDDLREKLFAMISSHIPDFDTLSSRDKLSVILGGQNEHIIRFSAKTCYDILDRRRTFLYK